MHGCCGHMGQVISDLVEKDTNAEIVAGIDVTDKGNTSYPVFTDIHECKTEAQVCQKNSLQKLKILRRRFRFSNQQICLLVSIL